MVVTKAARKRSRAAPAPAVPPRVVRRRVTSKQPEADAPVEICSSQEEPSGLQAAAARTELELSTEAFRASSVTVNTAPDTAVPEAEPAPDVAEERWFLALGSKIVGVQHYDGVVSDRESVVLRRQPANIYDPNAIQVLNIRGEQIGHVPREMASLLAPVMDRFDDGTGQLRVEGHIPRGSGNMYSIPVRLQIFGQANDANGSASSSAPRILRDLGQRLQRTYCSVARGAVEVLQAPEEGTPVQELTPQMWRQINGGKQGAKIAKVGPSMQDIIERELEEIFRQPGGYEGCPLAEQPAGLKTDLYPHQLKALHWMIQQERSLTVAEKLADVVDRGDSAVPAVKGKKKTETSTAQIFFWTKDTSKGYVIYKNLATNSAFRQAPKLPRGGILADDMGLGKTITTIALMLAKMDDAKRSCRGTGQNLVVCPLSVLYNWSEQLKLHVGVYRRSVVSVLPMEPGPVTKGLIYHQSWPAGMLEAAMVFPEGDWLKRI